MKCKSVARTLRRSRTISGALLTFAGTIGGIFHEAAQVAMQAATEFAALAPVAGLAAAMGVDTKTTMASLAFAGLALSVYARLDDAAKGKNPK
jgi:hypothetical protein